MTISIARDDVGNRIRGRRLIGLIVGLASLALLVVAAGLTPASDGLGTHRQMMNLPACGWIAAIETPCPTCGMTTAFAHAADGAFFASFTTQPFGFLLALATAIAMLVGFYTAATGSRIAVVFRRWWSTRMLWILVAAAALAWVYKIVSYRGLI